MMKDQINVELNESQIIHLLRGFNVNLQNDCHSIRITPVPKNPNIQVPKGDFEQMLYALSFNSNTTHVYERMKRVLEGNLR